MYTDLYSIYKQNTSNPGFWVKKKNWHNHVAQVLRVKNNDAQSESVNPDDSRVIVMIMDTRDNEIEEIVEIADPTAPQFKKLTKQYTPNYSMPQSMIDYIVKGA